MDELFSALTYFGLFQGIFLLIVLGLSPKHRRQINPYLFVLIGVLIIGLLGRTLYILEVFGKEPRLLSISEFALMLFGPSFALFIRSSINQEGFKTKDLWHYIPAVAHIFYLTNYFILASDEVIGGRLESGELIRIVLVLGVLGLSVNLAYWIWSGLLLNRFKKEISKEVSYAIKFRFLYLFWVAIGICLLIFFFIILTTYLNYSLYERVVYGLIWLNLTVIILFLGFYSITNPNIFHAKLPKSTKYVQSKLKMEEIARLKIELDELMASKKPFLNRKLMKAELADMLGVNSREMTRLLNEGFEMNFFEYTNFYRIKEFIALVESGNYSNLTLMGIAEKAGFNSKGTFNKAFKDIMGKTPSQYFR